jgi:hypothetical protein
MGKGIIAWGMVILVVAACGSSAETSQPDSVATQVAVARAVAATLTADAPTTAPGSTLAAPPTVEATREPTRVPQAADTATSEPATALPLPSATPAPTRTVPRPPTPTNTAVAEAADPFVPGVGTPKGLIGKIVLPGYAGPLDPPVFRDQIVFKLLVFDPAFGNVDGAGIRAVNIVAFDPLGQTVIDQREGSWAYCAFANPQNSPGCDVWRFDEHNFTWPNGTPVCAGSGYSANMVVETENPDNNEANWTFEFAVESTDGSLPSCF